MLQSFTPILIFFAIITACNNEAKTEDKETDTTRTTVVEPNNTTTTPSVDEQGCDKSLGQRYSKVTKGCVLLIDLVTLQPKEPKLDATKPAHLVFDSVRVEIFLPTQENSVVIRKTTSNPDVWENGPLKLTKTATGYRLEDEGKLLYAIGN
jgi:hypothetical protein